MFAYYVHDLSPFLIRFTENFGIRWYGLAYVLAFLLGIVVVRELSRRGLCDIPVDRVSDFVIGTAIFGVLLGGRIGYMLFYDFSHFLANPLIVVRVWDGGMSAHGGMLGVFFYTLWYSWRHKVSWRNLGDSIVVATPIGLFLGRLANFINGELYGRVTSVSWGMQFPKELNEPGTPPEMVQQALQDSFAINPAWDNVPAIIENVGHSPALREKLAGILSVRHPSQIYEALLEGLLLFAIMWVLRTKWKLRNGIITGAFFIGYAILRSICELFREPDAPLTGPFTRGQFLSFFLIVIGLAFWISAYVKPAYPKRQ